MKVGIRQYLVIFSSSFLLWILLVGSLRKDELLAGLVVALTVTVATKRAGIFSGIKFRFSALLALFRYLVNFSIALVRANIDMARRVLSPSLPIRPDMVEIRTHLKSDLGRLLLANSITLTPGTLTVDVQGEKLLIHWVDCPTGSDDLVAATEMIAAGFERDIQGFVH